MQVGSLMLFCVVLIGSLSSCRGDQRHYVDTNTYAIGNFINDSVPDGLVKFYDIKTNRIINHSTFVNGVKEGDETYYSLSGKKALSTPFTNGKQNGEIIVFNEKEEVVLRKNFYYDLPCGSEIEYRENTIRKYSFFSLENELLFELDYDSIQRREIHEAVSGFFFFRVEDIDVIGNGLDENAKRIFLYLLAPPSYDFRYSIVKLKPDGTSGPIVHSFDSTMGWGAYELPANSKPGELAICLNLTDPVGGRITMLKNLKW